MRQLDNGQHCRIIFNVTLGNEKRFWTEEIIKTSPLFSKSVTDSVLI